MPPSWGASRLLAFHVSNEIVIEVFSWERSCLLLILVFLGPLTGALIIVGGQLALPSFTTEEGADCFLPCCVVCHYVHQLIDGLRAIPNQFPHQVSTGGTRDKGQDDVVVGDMWQLGALF